MDELDPAQVWKVLEEQAREDAEVEAHLGDIVAMSDDALDAELRKYGVDVGEVETRARKVSEKAATRDGSPAGATAQAVPAEWREPARRKRPVAFWVGVAAAAAAAAAAATGGGVYVATHRTHAPENPAPPGPSPSPEPTETAPPEVVAARDLRRQASAALDAGHAQQCLDLLDRARAKDPAGDLLPEVTALRERAQRELPPEKPLKPRGP